MKAVLKSGSYKAVAEPVSINFYGWRNTDTPPDVTWINYTLSSNIEVGDVLYWEPNPMGISNPLHTVASVEENGFWDSSYNFNVRASEYDTTYTGTNYKLINQ